MNLWTNDEINRILTYLDSKELPFRKYEFLRDKGRLRLLGRGGSSYVFEAATRKDGKLGFAIKVIGFTNQSVDSVCFNESVEVQKVIGDYQDYVVRIYDHCEIWISFDAHDNIISVSESANDSGKNQLKLQFVLMEKISPIFERTKAGNIKMTPRTLEFANEQEILKLAYDVGRALQRAHDRSILHRDVKLENVFYSEKKKQYKLGDFGIAKKTTDGFASTVAFTKGYAAPEVRGTADNDRYDKTADIYSYGMMLYVLVNGLKFPDSNTYNVNSGIQYCKGYIIPPPENKISEELYSIIVKACMYDPDDRYQSMDEVILDIEKTMYSDSLGYKKAHKTASLTIGTILFLLGLVAWKLTIISDYSISFSLWEYIFILLGICKGLLKISKKKVALPSITMFGIGVYLLISSKASISMVIVVLMVISTGVFSAYMGAGLLVFNMVAMFQEISGITWNAYGKYNWIAISIISLGIVLLYQYEILSFKDRRTANLMYRKGVFWIVVYLLYIDMLLIGIIGPEKILSLLGRFIDNSNMNFLYNINWGLAGSTGLLFLTLWISREQILRYIEKKRNKR